MFLPLCISLFWLLSQAASRLTCYGRAPSETPFRPPLVPDCQYILARLPRPLAISKQGADLSTSSPFLPAATVHHASCLFTVFLMQGDAPPNLDSAKSLKPPSFPLSEADAIRIWDVAKRAADKVLTRCVQAQNPREGSVWGHLNIVDKGPMWYAVQVLAGWGGFSQADLLPIEEGRNAIKGSGEPQSPNLFGDTYYEL